MKNIKMSARILVLLTLLIWSFGGLMLKLISNSKTFTIMAIAMTAASFFNYIYVKRARLKSEIEVKFDLKFVLFSLCGYFFYWFFYLHSIACYDNMVSEPTVLNYTWPFFTGLFTILMYKRQQFDWVFIVSMLCGLMGIVVLATKGDLANLNLTYSYLGLSLGLLTGISYGLFSAYSSTLTDEGSRALYLFFGTAASAVLLFIVSFYKYGTKLFEITLMDLMYAFIVGLVFDSIGYALWTKAQSVAANNKMDISKVTNLANWLPLISIVLVAIFFQDERQVIYEEYFMVAFGLVLLSNLLPGWLRKLNV